MFEVLATLTEDGPSLAEFPDVWAAFEQLTILLERTIARHETSNEHLADGCLTMPSWLRHHCTLSHRAATALVTRGRYLHAHPTVADAATAGRLSLGHLQAIQRNTGGKIAHLFDTEHQTTLVAAIENLPVQDAEHVCKQWRELAEGLLDEPEPNEPERSFNIARTPDGTLHGTLTLNSAAATELETALATASTWDGPNDFRTQGQRNADAMFEICSWFNAHHTNTGTPRHRPHIELIIHTANPQPSGARPDRSVSEGFRASGRRFDDESSSAGPASPASPAGWGWPVDPAQWISGPTAGHLRLSVVRSDSHTIPLGQVRWLTAATWTAQTAADSDLPPPRDPAGNQMPGVIERVEPCGERARSDPPALSGLECERSGSRRDLGALSGKPGDPCSAGLVRDGTAVTVEGEPLSEGATRAFLCDCVIHRVTASPDWPTAYGRAVRTIPRPLFRAVALRDGGCRFPGCCRKVAWCDGHHLVHWEDGGTTDQDNVALLCSRHHHLIHQRGWTVTLEGDATLTVTNPYGVVTTSRPHGQLAPAARTLITFVQPTPAYA